MQLERIPLETRIEKLKNGYAAHPEYIACCIKNMADAPISAYLYQFEDEKDKLALMLRMDTEALDTMTYKEVAYLIYERLLQSVDADILSKAADLLAAPIKHCFNERCHRYANFKQNPPSRTATQTGKRQAEPLSIF